MKYSDTYSYPAVFSTDGDGWEVRFPDIDNCFTAADTLEQAIIEARYVLEDIMYLREKEKDEIPSPAKLEDIKTKPGEIVQLVVAVMPEVRREHSRKSVKKTLTIPAWMEEELKKRSDINVSFLLQNAIRQELNLIHPDLR
jgi:predicted RNase H-like HicB family nuclease